jgi:hypothetical protein
MQDLIVDVLPSCEKKGPCDLLLHHDQVTPKEKIWTELWSYDGKKYKKVKSKKGVW